MAGEKDLKLDEGGQEEGGGKGKGKLIIIIIAALVLVGAAVGVTLFLISGDSAEPEDAPKEAAVPTQAPAQYVKLKPEFVINFQVGPRQRFLQLYIEVMTRDGLIAAGLEEHSPRVRSEIIRVISQQDFEFLRTAEGRSELQTLISDTVKQVMREEVGSDAVEQILFTNYVMQ